METHPCIEILTNGLFEEVRSFCKFLISAAVAGVQRGRPQPAGSRRTHPEKGRSPSAGEGQPGSGSCCRRVTTAPAFPHPGPTRRRLASLARASRKRTRGGGNREGRAEQALPRSRPTRPRLSGRAQARCPRRPLPPPPPRRRADAAAPAQRVPTRRAAGKGGGGLCGARPWRRPG